MLTIEGSLMLFITFLLFAALMNGSLNKEIGKGTKEEAVDGNCDVEKSPELENVDRT